jgi:hypothetical protein
LRIVMRDAFRAAVAGAFVGGLAGWGGEDLVADDREVYGVAFAAAIGALALGLIGTSAKPALLGAIAGAIVGGILGAILGFLIVVGCLKFAALLTWLSGESGGPIAALLGALIGAAIAMAISLPLSMVASRCRPRNTTQGGSEPGPR